MKRRTLRRRIYALLARWFLLFMAAAGVVMTFAFGRLRDAALDERRVLARAVARNLDSAIGDLFHNLRGLAEDGGVDGKAVERLRAWRFHHLFRDAVYVLDARAQVVLAQPPGVEPLAAPPRHESVTPLSYKSRDRLPFVAVVQPFQVGREHFSLVAEMHLRGSLVSAMLRDLAAGTDLRLLVVDARGAILAAADERGLLRTIPPADEVGRRILAHRPFVDPRTACWTCAGGGEDRDHFTLMVPLELAPWGVVLQQPRDQVFAALYAARATLLGTLALLAGFGVFLSWVLTRTVVSPLRELSDQAAGLRAGDLERPIAVAGDQELHVLARTLDEARQKLRGSLEELRRLNENLELEVAERTAEIAKLLATTLDQDAQRRVLVRRLLEAGEEERKRIARELHDEISQLLAIVQISLDEVPAAAVGDALAKAKALLLRTQEELHRLIYDLRPSLLDDLGLAAAVKWYAENYLEPRGLAAHLEIEEDLAPAPEVEITAFRIYQEIVTNILRHARAENVSVELYAAGGKLVLAVEDDGVGFAAGTTQGGVGIVGMRERAEIVGGTLKIDSGEPGMGTQVIVELPLQT